MVFTLVGVLVFWKMNWKEIYDYGAEVMIKAIVIGAVLALVVWIFISLPR